MQQQDSRAAASNQEMAEQPAIDLQNIGELASSLLDSNPETSEQLARYKEAVVRMEQAKAKQAEFEAWYLQASKEAALADLQDAQQQVSTADSIVADAEVAAAEKLLQAAELEFAAAEAAKLRLAQDAGREAERPESVKASGVAAVAGTVSSLLLTLTAGGSASGLAEALDVAGVALSCALFGAMYRYAVRGDVGNTHLSGGVVAAFALVRAAGCYSGLASSAASSGGGDVSSLLVDAVLPAALYGGQGMLMFGFAAVAVEAAMAQGLVKRFTSTQ